MVNENEVQLTRTPDKRTTRKIPRGFGGVLRQHGFSTTAAKTAIQSASTEENPIDVKRRAKTQG
jgi:hypothetical protein